MSEFQEHPTIPTEADAGDILHAEREHQGLSIDEVAEQLNLRPSLVADLEIGRFDQIPVRAYQRGYLRAYARLLGVDENIVIGAYDRTHGRNDVEERRVTPIQTVKPPSRWGKIIFRLMTLLVIIVLAALTLLWWQSRQGAPSFDTGANSGLNATGQSAVPGTALPQQSGDNTVAGDTALAEPSTPVAASAPENTASEPTQTAVTATPTAAAQTPGAASSPLPADEERLQRPTVDGRNGSSIIQDDAQTPADDKAAAADQINQLSLTFNGKSWVDIRGANGTTLLRGLQNAGTSAEVKGEPPFHMTIGNASDVKLQYRGQSVDLRSHAGSSNVAKFTLGE